MLLDHTDLGKVPIPNQIGNLKIYWAVCTYTEQFASIVGNNYPQTNQFFGPTKHIFKANYNI